MTETPGVWTVSVHFCNRHPAELRRFVRETGGAVQVLDTSEAEVREYWLTATPPLWAEPVADRPEVIGAALHEERSAARKAAWQRRREEVPA